MMNHHYFDSGSEINGQGPCGDDMGENSGRPMIAHVISLLQALIGILDIISSMGRHK